MKEKGKDICHQLKEIRNRIATENGIPLEEHECHYNGPCSGTCPRCDAELQYLERELGRRGKLGKAAIVAGVTLGLAVTSCTTEGDPYEPNYMEGDIYTPEDTTQCQNNEKASDDSEALYININEG